MIKQGLAPIIDNNTRILVLGSLPGDESIRRQEYYAHPGNDFWKLISAVIGENITKLNYNDRIMRLKAHKIGLWDVYGFCERKGSLDYDIRSPQLNDFTGLPDVAPGLSLICFNGQKAGQHCDMFEKMGYTTTILPSSSGANRKNSSRRLESWKSIIPLAE